MNLANKVCLSGIISQVYPAVTTPNGVKVARMLLEHNSKQLEAGELRQVKCKIFCVYIAGEIMESQLNQLVSINGFLSVNRHKELVLHITNIKNLD